jgi:hypothetical protein
MNFHYKNIAKETPLFIRKSSTAVCAGCTVIAGTSFLGNHDMLMLVWAHVGAFAKMLSIFFADETQ